LEEEEMAKGRRVVNKQKQPQRVRMLNGEVVTPVRCYSNVVGQRWNLMGGQVGRDGESIKGSDGRPVPFQSIGELVWK